MFTSFYNLSSVDERLKFLDETFTPIVFAAIREYQGEKNLPGKLI